MKKAADVTFVTTGSMCVLGNSVRDTRFVQNEVMFPAVKLSENLVRILLIKLPSDARIREVIFVEPRQCGRGWR